MMIQYNLDRTNVTLTVFGRVLFVEKYKEYDVEVEEIKDQFGNDYMNLINDNEFEGICNKLIVEFDNNFDDFCMDCE